MVKSNNKACSLIRIGCNESAITHLHKTLLSFFQSQRHKPHRLISPCHHQPCPHERCNDKQPIHYYTEYEFDEGMSVFSQPFHICDKCGDEYGNASTEAVIFFNLGIAHARIGEDQEALACLKKSLKLQVITASTFDGEESTRVINGPNLHMLLHNIGHLHWENARYTEAIRSYSQALDYLSSAPPELQHQLHISCTLNCIAVSMFYAGERNTDDVLTIFERALALRLGTSRGTTFDREKATIINNSGRIRFIRGEFVAAFRIYKEAYNQRVTVLGKDHIDVAASLFNMAQAKEYQSHALEAIALYKQFVGIVSGKKGNRNMDMMIRALVNIGQLSYDHGDLEQAQDSFSRALDFIRVNQTPYNQSVAKISKKLGQIFLDQCEYTLALEAFKSVLTFERLTHQEPHAHIAMTLMDIAHIKHCQSDLDQCLKFYTEALEIIRQLNDQEEVSRMLIDLGLVYVEKGDFDDATKALEEAVVIARKNLKTDNSLLPCALNVLGLIHHKKGSYTLALSSFLEAIKIYKTFYNVPPLLEIAALYQNTGTVYREIGESDKALHYYQYSLRLGKMHSQRFYEKSASLNYEIGMIFKEREDFDKALSHLNQSLQLCMESACVTQTRDISGANSGLAAKVYSGLAVLYLQKGDIQMAMQSLVDATELSRTTGDLNFFGDFAYYSFLYQILRRTNAVGAAAA